MMLRIALRRFALATAFGCTLAAPASLLAQEPPTLTFGTIAKISSKILGEERRINLLLPPGYEGSSEKYPVFYLLDGSAHEDYFHAASLVDFMATYGVMPKTIVVGISNVDRKRDFTKPSKDEGDTKLAPTSGGAEKFVAFVEKELIPYVEANYRTDGKSTLFGQSLAGLLATQILLEKPGLFDNYIIVSPSLWWSRSELLGAAPELLKKNSAPGRKVYLSVGKEHPQMVEEAHAFAKLLAGCAWPGFAHRFDYLETENHATNGHISLYRGLELLFKQP
jgi:predicted alpha/beta superfamily hydrolase